MAKIPLRTYLKEIENQIERGEIDQAVAQAKHIIRSYPKHIDSYRLLGKAFLESQRFGEASDILQRVLSVIPDDFVSQIGMSIIREDEGNLDAAIWHMERAYEVQPANSAVQDELRRLYGRRDGVEPPKIRLTRGALVRMYMRGELYPQAIAEIRAALADDPNRYDLLVLLARLYYLSGQRFEATEVCSTLISKLPNCYDANKILAEILPGTSRAEDARKFQQRIYALDPYTAFLSPTAATVDQVADQSVQVEQYDWNPDAQETQAPDWTRNIGVAWEEKVEEDLPDWINTLRVDAPPAISQPAVQPTAETPPPAAESEPSGTLLPQDELVPDWMKEAGWTASSHSADEVMTSEQQAEDQEIIPADIPDWLQSKAPEMPEAQETTREERTDWLETILTDADSPEQPSAPEQAAQVEDADLWASFTETPSPAEIQAEEEAQPISPAQEIPDWIEAQEQPAAQEPAAPDWLLTLQEESEGNIEAEPATDVPGWLKTETSQAAASRGDETLPDWLKHFGEEPESVIPAAENSQSAAEQVSEPQIEDEQALPWLEQLSVAADESQPGEILSSAEEDITTWMQEEDAAAQPAQVQETLTASAEEVLQPEAVEQPEAQVPDWLKDFSEPETGLEDETASLPLVEMPSVDMAKEQAPAIQPETTPIDLSDTDDAMAWLESLAARQGADEATLITSPEERVDTPPEWVKKEIERSQLEESAPAAVEQAEVEPAAVESLEPEMAVEDKLASIPVDEPEKSEEIDMDAAMAWLESLAARQGADEETLFTAPEQRVETPPDWVLQEMETARHEETAFEEAVESGLTDEFEEPALEAEAIPDWLQEMVVASEPQPQEVQPEIPEVQELPVSTIEASTEAVETEPSVEFAPPGEPAEPISPFASDTPAAAADARDDFDATFAWLESLAARQGADAETLLTTPEERVEEPPAWVQSEASQAEETGAFETVSEEQAVEPEYETAQPAVPDWLASIEEEQAAQVAGWPEELSQPEQPEETVEEPELPLPAWMQENVVEDQTAPQPETSIPDWLAEITGDEESAAYPSEPEPALSTTDIRSAWEPEMVSQATVDESPVSALPSNLAELQEALNRGNVDPAIEGYNQMIQKGEYLPETISALRDALYRYPVDISIWQALGDAYARNDQLQEAIDAYTKAEELLR